MHAVRIHVHGGPEQLVYEEVPDPIPGPGQVVVRVRAAGVNRRDLWICRGRSDIQIALPCVPGMDIAGEIAEIGASVDGLHLGQRVVVAPGSSCGACAHCRRGAENLCREFRVLGSGLDGGYAERVAVPARNLFPVADTVSLIEAATLPVSYVTAWHLLVTLGQLQPDEQVLIHAVGSGTGLAALQLAHLLGAHPIVTAGAGWKLEKAREYGAVEAINYENQDFVAAVLARTGGRGVDMVVEQVGGRVFEESLEVLARGGRLLTFGATAGSRAQIDLLRLQGKRVRILASAMGTRDDLRAVLRLVEEGRLKPVVHAVLPLREARQAHHLLEDRAQFGKIVLVP